MSGAFVGISVARSRRINRRTRRALLDINSTLGGPVRRVWGDVGPGRAALLSWERESSLGTLVHHGADEAQVVCGVPAMLDAVATTQGAALGIRSLAGADATGAIWASCDDMGYGSIFCWQGAGVVAFSTRSELVAEVASIVGEPPSKDSSIAAELTHIGFLGPTRTGWCEISALRAGESIRLVDGAARRDLDAVRAGWAHEPRDRIALDDHVERASALLQSDIARILGLGVPVFADLTAGRDSRIILAALLALGAEGDVTLQTVGGLETADVRVAAAIAAHYDIDHRYGYFYPLPGDDFADRFRHHVDATAGVSNAMDGIREQHEPVEHLRLSGLIGEVSRGWRTAADREAVARDVPDQVTQPFGAGRLDILRPAARAKAEASIRAEILDTGHADLPAWHAVHRYYSEVRLRGRMSRVDDFTPEVRVYPLYTPELVALGVRSMWHHPDSDVASIVTERLAPGVGGLDVEVTSTRLPAGVEHRRTEPSLMRAALEIQAQLRQEYFATLAQLDSAAWELIDRDAYVRAVDDYDSLSHGQNRLLHGAAGAIVWLAE